MCEEFMGTVSGLGDSFQRELSKQEGGIQLDFCISGSSHWLMPSPEMWRRRKRECGWVREAGWAEGEAWSGTWGRLLMPGSVQYFPLHLLLVTDPTSSGHHPWT